MHMVIHLNVAFSDAFDLQFGVCVLRMREGLEVSSPSQSHGESLHAYRSRLHINEPGNAAATATFPRHFALGINKSRARMCSPHLSIIF